MCCEHAAIASDLEERLEKQPAPFDGFYDFVGARGPEE